MKQASWGPREQVISTLSEHPALPVRARVGAWGHRRRAGVSRASDWPSHTIGSFMHHLILTDDDLISSMVEYHTSDRALSGFLCRPKGTEPLPALLLIQEWWGLNDHIKEVAQRLAKEHYVVFAPDLYSRLGNVVTQNAAEAAKLSEAIPTDQLLSDLLGAVRYLKGLPHVNERKVGVIGFCVGGSYALSLACRTEEIRCAVPFYGEVPPDAELEKLSA